MANANAPRGLIPYRRVSGEPYNAAGNIYYVPATYATAIFIGDPVVLVTAGGDSQGIPQANVATAGSSNAFIGACAGIIPGGEPQIAVTRDQPPYHAASTAGYILVVDDPEALYVVQENGNMGAGAAGRNVNLVAGSGSTVTGYSGWQLNSSTLAVTATLQMRVIRMLEQADNAVGTNAKWLCRINLNQMLQALGT